MKRKIHFWTAQVLLLLTTVALNSCAGIFQSKIYMDNSDSYSSSISDFFRKEEQKKVLGTPTDIQISKGLYADRIVVSWSPVKNASAYRLERAVVTETDDKGNPILPKGNDFKTLNTTDIYYKTAYTDIVLTDNDTYTSPKFNNYYFYRVCALKTGIETDESDYFPDYDEKENEEGDSIEESARTAGKTSGDSPDPELYGSLFKPPLNIEAAKGKKIDGIDITWSEVENATAYEILRSETSNGYYYTIKSVYATETSYFDEIAEKYQGDEFYYKVRAVNSIGEESIESSAAMGYTLMQGAPSAPNNVQVVNGLGESSLSLKIKWDKVDTNGIEGNVTYSLYRNTATDSTYNLLKSNIDPNTIEHEDKKVSPGVYYYYYVQTIAENTETKTKIKSSFSDSGKDSKSPAYGFLIAPPTSVEVDDAESEDKVTLRWSPAINVLYEQDKKVEYTYNIYYDNDLEGTFTNKIAALDPQTDNNGKLYVEAPKKNFFTIRTVSPDNVESVKSDIFAPVPNAPTNVVVSKTIGYGTALQLVKECGMALVEEQWLPNTNGVYPVVVKWNAPMDTVAGYNVYRSTTPSSGFKKVNDSMITQTCYVDSSNIAKAGVFYYYKVTSLNSLGQGTKSNNPAVNDPKHEQRGYGALTLEQWFTEYNENIAKSQSKLSLMHKPNDLDKVGSEARDGIISGQLAYNAKVQGLGAEITMPYTNYADYFISDTPTLGIKYVLNGNTNTTSNMSANGNMHGTVNCYTYYIDTANPGDAFDKLPDGEKQKILATKDTSYLVGMYPGYVKYDKIEVKGGAAGGGYYSVQTYELEGCKKDGFGSAKIIQKEDKIDWTFGEKTFKYH